ncbi:unnamed protein product [Amoebophrya sp. A120]|nr:unnamed protein product [Amoebophrya sp. A120]|eukprot:GSA120T00003303001.1
MTAQSLEMQKNPEEDEELNSVEAHLQRFREILDPNAFEYLGTVDPAVVGKSANVSGLNIMEFEDVLLDEDNLFYLPKVEPHRGRSERLGRFYHFLDKTTLYVKSRWGVFVFLLFLLTSRIYALQGFFLVAYACSIYLLNLVLGFLTPAVDPELDNRRAGDTDTEDFRPFVRQVPEFKFWFDATRCVVISLTLTMFPCFDLPVFWPVLLVYFLLLTFFTLKERIKHMIRHRYLPFTYGKKTYNKLPEQDPGENPPGTGGGKENIV